MVRLDRIYTGGGDNGQTSLGDGLRVAKTHAGIIAGGSVDELNCAIGVAIAGTPDSSLVPVLRQLQQLLFDLGADLCCRWNTGSAASDRVPRMTPVHVAALEQLIDQSVARLEPLRSFVLPGGTVLAAALHLARGICRRAEIDVLRLAETQTVNPDLLVCMNRLSDLLFVLARSANENGTADVLWEPGQSFGSHEIR